MLSGPPHEALNFINFLLPLTSYALMQVPEDYKWELDLSDKEHTTSRVSIVKRMPTDILRISYPKKL